MDQLQETPYEYSVEGISFAVDAEQFSLAIYNALYDVTQLRFVPLIGEEGYAEPEPWSPW